MKRIIEDGKDAQSVPQYMAEHGAYPGDEPVDDVEHDDTNRQASARTWVAGSAIAVESRTR